MRKLTLAFCCLALAACRDSKPDSGITDPPVGGSGTFSLSRVNGRALPSDVSSRIVYGGFLQLNASGEYTREQQDSTKNIVGGYDRVRSQDHGTWISRNDSIFLTTTFSTYGYGPGVGVFTATGARVTTKNPFASGSLDLEFQRQP